MGFYVVNGLGDSLQSPSTEEMRKFLAGIDVADEEHGAAWLSTDDGYSLEWSGDGRLVFTAGSESPPRYLRGVSVERALELWLALAAGNVEEVERCAWHPGNGYVLTPEREAELREWQDREDRAFYDLLGEERTDVPCRSDGCSRGAVSLSALCRVHHFEMVRKRPIPFKEE
jgi:hypothetical protein